MKYQELLAYKNVIRNISMADAMRIIGSVGSAAWLEFTGLPDSGAGVMTKDLWLFRNDKCDKCPLKTGNRCDPSQKRDHVYEKDHNGMPKVVYGCGCGLWAKKKDINEHCPAGEW